MGDKEAALNYRQPDILRQMPGEGRDRVHQIEYLTYWTVNLGHNHPLSVESHTGILNWLPVCAVQAPG